MSYYFFKFKLAKINGYSILNMKVLKIETFVTESQYFIEYFWQYLAKMFLAE